jgi:YfiH family protein
MITKVRSTFGTRLEPISGENSEEWNSSRPRWRQVHGTSVARVTIPSQECGEVDALWTTEPGIPMGVVTADCVPILLARNDGTAVAAIHAGWRGTYARIVTAFFRSLPQEHADPTLWTARIGPCIRPCCYEVGDDLIRTFLDEFPEFPRNQIEPASRRLDLVALNRGELERLGVRVVEVHADCTYCAGSTEDFRYFSYRRGDRNSRQFSVISIQKGL